MGDGLGVVIGSTIWTSGRCNSPLKFNSSNNESLPNSVNILITRSGVPLALQPWISSLARFGGSIWVRISLPLTFLSYVIACALCQVICSLQNMQRNCLPSKISLQFGFGQRMCVDRLQSLQVLLADRCPGFRFPQTMQ